MKYYYIKKSKGNMNMEDNRFNKKSMHSLYLVNVHNVTLILTNNKAQHL